VDQAHQPTVPGLLGCRMMRMPTAEQAAEARERARPDGETTLKEVHTFLDRFVVYPTEDAHVAHTLWVAHTFFMDHWDSTFVSPSCHQSRAVGRAGRFPGS
jgi:hypothetical protein